MYAYLFRTVNNIEMHMMPPRGYHTFKIIACSSQCWYTTTWKKKPVFPSIIVWWIGHFQTPRKRLMVEYANSSKIIAGMVINPIHDLDIQEAQKNDRW